MTMHPLDIIKRDMAVAKTLTDRSRRPMRQESPETLKWLRDKIPAFAEMRDRTEARLADEAENRRKYRRK